MLLWLWCNIIRKSIFSNSPSPEESKATNGSSKQLRSSIQTKVSVDDIHCRDIEKGVNKRHQRLQPMVMVWNTHFPNGKMIPLRQPQPPVYFGPVIAHSNENQGCLQSSQDQKQQGIMNNTGNTYHHNQVCEEDHINEIVAIKEADQNSNRQKNSNTINHTGSSTLCSSSDKTIETRDHLSHAPSPIYSHVQPGLPVVGPV